MEKDGIDNILVMGKSGAGKQPRIDVLTEEFGLEQISTGDIFRHYIGIYDGCGADPDPGALWDEEKHWFRDDELLVKEMEESCGEEPDRSEKKDLLLGLKAKFFVDSGKYVPDRITNSLFANYFKRAIYRGTVLDGYPRTVDQAKFLLELSRDKGFSVDFGVLVENSDEMILRRLTGRRICPSCKKVFHLEFKPPENGGYCTECGTEVIKRADDEEKKIKSRLKQFHEKTKPAIDYLEAAGLDIVKVPGHLAEFTPENVRRSVMERICPLIEDR